ncbi:MAG: APC family permease [Aridibacter famidurans]|nr:APC family permease [Aridibacter famidurans]
MGFNATWSMAVGGMVGGGIFSTLGVVISISGSLAWLSFIIGGMIALAAGYSYSTLVSRKHEGGGAFTFLRQVGATSTAGTLAWVLIVGYVLTNAVYAFTFGQYLGHLLELGAWFPKACAIAILLLFVALNLKGVGEASGVEIFLVWFKLAVLAGLAIFGLWLWDPPMLSRGVSESTLVSALLAAASVFMAYEGFQLLAYDYEDIGQPDKTLPRATLTAIAVVIAVYVAVALGTAMLVGADQVVEHKEVALSIAGAKAAGLTGLVIVTVAAAFSTGSAINSTLFATARLVRKVASEGELPAALDRRNKAGVPEWAVVGLGALSAVFALFGSIDSLVESASIAFLITFSFVCSLAFKEGAGSRFITGPGALGAALAAIALGYRLVTENPLALGFLASVILAAVFIRPLLLRRFRTE